VKIGFSLLAVSLVITAWVTFVDFSTLEAFLYDLKVSTDFTSHASKQIALVALDDLSLQELDEFAPLTWDQHLLFLERLTQLQPRAIGYLMDFNEVDAPSLQASEKEQLNWRMRFFQQVKRTQAQGITVVLGAPYDVTGEILPPWPLNELPHAIALIHKDGNIFSKDQITRRALLTLNDQPSFHLRLANQLQPPSEPPGMFWMPGLAAEIKASYFLFRHYPTHEYTTFSWIDIPQKADTLKNKIVLVGTTSSENPSNFTQTPLVKTSMNYPKLLVHAQILDSLLKHEGIQEVSHKIENSLTFLMVFMIFAGTLFFSPSYALLAKFALLSMLFILSQVIFSYGYWLPISNPLVGVFLSYCLAMPCRLFHEHQKRWQYQKKIKMQTVRTHFLALITHDLKTPLARIQGLTELLLRKPENLTNNLKTILQSTMQLNKFISRILQVNQIDCEELKLQREFKDINVLIEQCVHALTPIALQKEIRLVTILEPLFPIPLDPQLIAKVLTNLIDNAIAYSKVGSVIKIHSLETHDEIVIAIEDQGLGIAPEEKEHLFERFHRGKNHQASGSGLGLYLSDYFVKSHGGKITVESTQGLGSTFRVFLPIQEKHAKNSRS